jgi:hypothetical protein
LPDNRFQGHRVSTSWDLALTHAQRMGVHFQLNSGRRTMAEQWFLWRNRGKPGFAKLVAFPTPNAPHIRVGRQAHSLDVDTHAGGETHLQRFLAKEGLHPVNDVAGEPWHITVGERELRRYAKRVRARQKKAGH